MAVSTSPSPPSSRRSIPPLVLLSFAVLHSQVCWLYSIIYHLCNNLSDRPLDLSLDDTVLQALTKCTGRARAFSEPQQTSCVMLQQRQTLNDSSSSSKITRPRSTTISATTVDADVPLQRQQWVQQFQARVHEQQLLLNTTIEDERLGRTRPPRWWQRTRRHLTRQDNDSSTLSLSSSMDFERTNSNHEHHLTLCRPVSPPSSCDMQPHYHNDIITMRIDDNNNERIRHSDLLASLSLNNTNNLSTTIVASSLGQQQRQRPLAKIRSVLIKSQIEPENKDRSMLNPKRKTVLRLPSRWSITNTGSETTTTTKRYSVRIKDQTLDDTTLSDPASRSKRRLFSSLPAWKRKSVG